MTYNWHKKLFYFFDCPLQLWLGSIFTVFHCNEHMQFVIEMLPIRLASILLFL